MTLTYWAIYIRLARNTRFKPKLTATPEDCVAEQISLAKWVLLHLWMMIEEPKTEKRERD